MKKLNLVILAAAFATSSFAETLYVNGKPVDQKIIDQAMAQFKKSSPMAAEQMNNPQFKKQLILFRDIVIFIYFLMIIKFYFIFSFIKYIIL
jgi:hypothetical protein